MPTVVSCCGHGARGAGAFSRARRFARACGHQCVCVPCRHNARLPNDRRVGAANVRVLRIARPGGRLPLLHDHRLSVLDEVVVGSRRCELARAVRRPIVSNRAHVSRGSRSDAADRACKDGVRTARAARRCYRRRRTVARAWRREPAARCERLSRDARASGSDVDDLLRMGVLCVTARERSGGTPPRTLAVGRRCAGGVHSGKRAASFQSAGVLRLVSQRHDRRLPAEREQDVGRLRPAELCARAWLSAAACRRFATQPYAQWLRHGPRTVAGGVLLLCVFGRHVVRFVDDARGAAPRRYQL